MFICNYLNHVSLDCKGSFMNINLRVLVIRVFLLNVSFFISYEINAMNKTGNMAVENTTIDNPDDDECSDIKQLIASKQDQMRVNLRKFQISKLMNKNRYKNGQFPMQNISISLGNTSRKTPVSNTNNIISSYMKEIHLEGQMQEENNNIDLQERSQKLASEMGYKALNCSLMEKLLENDSLQSQCKLSVKVPKFFIIESSNVKYFLLNSCSSKIDIDKEWKDIVEQYSRDRNDEKLINNSQKFSEKISNEFTLFCTESNLNFEIENVFKLENHFKDQKVKSIVGYFNEENFNIKVMVRSTGANEDTDSITNAGGNTSVTNVSLTKEELFFAIRDVVVSYFEKKSLQQRCDVSDPSLLNSNENPVIPAMIQIMIGENYEEAKKSERPPKCGVIFTTNPMLGLDPKTNKPYDDSIMVCNSTNGNNSAIVDSKYQINFDTTYLLKGENNLFFKKTTDKDYRLVPDGKTLEKVENLKNIKNKHSLSDSELSDLMTVASRIEKFYDNKPMDIEFIIQKNILYILQARPLLMAKADANYINNIEGLGVPIHKIYPISLGKANVVKITNKRQIIYSTTASDALDIYNDLDKEKKEEIKIVLVDNFAPETSHEISTLRLKGIPVAINDRDLINNNTDYKKNHLFFDLQQQAAVVLNIRLKPIIIVGWKNYPLPPGLTIYDFPSTKRMSFTDYGIYLSNFEDQKPNIIAEFANDSTSKLLEKIKNYNCKDGDTSKVREMLLALRHNLYNTINLHIKYLTEQLLCDLDLITERNSLFEFFDKCSSLIVKICFYPKEGMQKEFLMQILENLIMQQQYSNVVNSSSFTSFIKGLSENQHMIENLKEEDKLIKKCSCNHLLSSILRIIHSCTKNNQLDESQIKSIYTHAYDLSNELAALNNLELQSDLDYTLRASLFHNTYNNVNNICEKTQHAKGLDTELQKFIVNVLSSRKNPCLNPVGLQFLELKKYILDEESRKNWTSFVPELNKDLTNENKFSKMFLKLYSLKILVPWINTIFPEKFEKYNIKTSDMLKEFFKELNDAEEFLETINYLDLKNSLDSLNPDNFEKEFSECNSIAAFCENIAKKFMDISFINGFHNINSLGKFILIGLMQKFVDLFDISIKKVKVIEKFSMDKRIHSIIEMVRSFANVFNTWITYFNESNSLSFANRENLRKNNVVKTLIIDPLLLIEKENFDDINENEIIKNQFTLSRNFIVSQEILGGGSSEPKETKNLEECFTTIHQSFVNFLAVLGKNLYTKVNQCKQFSCIHNKIMECNQHNIFDFIKQQALSTSPEIKQFGIVMDDKCVEIYYNLPLRGHGLKITVFYNFKKSSTSISFNLFGSNEHGRWNLIKRFVDVFFEYHEIHKDNCLQKNDELSFKWQIKNNNSFSFINYLIVVVSSLSLEATNNLGDPAILNKYYDKFSDQGKLRKIMTHILSY
jgi:hypothetical protein